MIIVTGTITLDPDKVDDLMAAALKAMAATREEEGNIDYVFSVDPETPGKVRILEQWESQEALDAHFTTAQGVERIETDPGNSNDGTVESVEPGITLIIGGAGLSCQVAASQAAGLARRAMGDDIAHHGVHQVMVLF